MHGAKQRLQEMNLIRNPIEVPIPKPQKPSILLKIPISNHLENTTWKNKNTSSSKSRKQEIFIVESKIQELNTSINTNFTKY